MGNDILSMVGDNLHVALSSSLHKVKKSRQSIVTRNIHISTGEGESLIDMTVDPIPYEKTEALHYHVYFERIRPAQQAPPPELPDAANTDFFEFNDHYRQHVADLEAELQAIRADFLANQESLQTAIEELNSTNEEFQAANEELQSANEELQSTNEELYSVNTEFESTNNELKQLNAGTCQPAQQH